MGTFGGGVSRFNGDRFITYTSKHGLANNDVWCILEDKGGYLWFGTNAGVSRFDGKTFITLTEEQGLSNNLIRSITQDRHGNIWFGTARGGVSRLLKEELDKLENFQAIADGDLTVKFDQFKSIHGLANDIVNGIIEDKNGNIIIGTNLGFTVIPVSASTLPFGEVEEHLEYFHTQNGYPLKAINPTAMFYSSDNILWAGTASNLTGLLRFDYSKLHQTNATPLPVIQSIKIKDENICWYDLLNQGIRTSDQDSITSLLHEFLAYGRNIPRSEEEAMIDRFGNIQFDGITAPYPLPENLVLPYEHNQITFDFLAIETAKPSQVRYQYLLEGYNDDWSPISDLTQASFGNMREGRYTFKVKAIGAEGNWTDPISYSFRVLPPWYRTWWAYTVFGLLIIIGVYTYIRWRTNALQKEKEVLEKRVDDRTQKLKESLEHLKSTQDQLIHSEKMASLGELTAGIAHEIKNPLNFINNFSELNMELSEELLEEWSQGEITKEEARDMLINLKENSGKIAHHGHRADRIVKSMLEHSRSGTGEKTLTDLNKLTEEYLNLAYHGYRAKEPNFNPEIIRHFAEDLPPAMIVPQDIGRVLLNLINNALYASSAKAQATADPNFNPIVTVSTKKLDKKIEINVADNGPGIPPDIQDKIFQPFFTTKPTGQGTGLGLSLSYDIVKAHGGELSVQSVAGESTTFQLLLPVT